MIFKSVSYLQDKTERNFFIEKVKIYIRLVEVFCELNNYTMTSQFTDADIVQELKDIGVIKENSDLLELKKLIKEDYKKFTDAVKFVVEHKEAVGDILDNLYNSKRLEKQRNIDKSKPTLVDFFCGAGGLSLGFIQNGFRVVLANDIEDVCIETYRYNHPELPSHKVVKGDIKDIVDNVGDYLDEEVDIVVGGPPCQGFSEANRQRVIDDPRNHLYKYFVKAVENIVPKFVVMENVKGMLKVADQVVEDYQALKIHKNNEVYSYSVAYRLLNSVNFSVAQSRERLIYIAVRNDVAAQHNITPEDIFKNIEKDYKKNGTFNLEDALKDIKSLEAPRVKNTNEIDDDVTGKKIDANINYNHRNKYLNLINQGREIKYLFNHKARYCSDVNYEIYKRLNPGDDATDEKIVDIMPYAHRNHCFKDKYFKLIPDRPCRTITAHLRMDCHSHIHPYQIRSLTPREAARVQSFPDDYLFMGAYLKTYMQIGNAVPTLMARGIADKIKRYL